MFLKLSIAIACGVIRENHRVGYAKRMTKAYARQGIHLATIPQAWNFRLSHEFRDKTIKPLPTFRGTRRKIQNYFAAVRKVGFVTPPNVLHGGKVVLTASLCSSGTSVCRTPDTRKPRVDKAKLLKFTAMG